MILARTFGCVRVVWNRTLAERHRLYHAEGENQSYAAFYSALGRPAGALPLTEEAVAIRRELAATIPDRYRPDLAQSLSALADVLAQLDKTAEAEAARPESGELWPPGDTDRDNRRTDDSREPITGHTEPIELATLAGGGVAQAG